VLELSFRLGRRGPSQRALRSLGAGPSRSRLGARAVFWGINQPAARFMTPGALIHGTLIHGTKKGWAHFFPFSPISTRRRMASERPGLSG
jgi:hypothetical protein